MGTWRRPLVRVDIVVRVFRPRDRRDICIQFRGVNLRRGDHTGVGVRSRLQLLKGGLGPFGLFRTLSYPIDAQKLQLALVRSRAHLEIDPPAAPSGGASAPGPVAVRPIVKRISLVSADALFSTNVPLAIASMGRIRPSESSRLSWV